MGKWAICPTCNQQFPKQGNKIYCQPACRKQNENINKYGTPYNPKKYKKVMDRIQAKANEHITFTKEQADCNKCKFLIENKVTGDEVRFEGAEIYCCSVDSESFENDWTVLDNKLIKCEDFKLKS